MVSTELQKAMDEITEAYFTIFIEMTGELPDAVVACVGGGSNSAGFFSGFLNDPVDIYGIEPLGRGDKDMDYIIENYGIR